MQFNNLRQASCEGTLYRKFLGKITHDLRNAVLTRTWQLDEDPSVPPRKPKTWEEVADAIEQELATRADVKAPTEQVHRVSEADLGAGGSSLQRCRHCQRPGHPPEQCPKRAAEVRGESASLIAKNSRSGRACKLCGGGDHREHHHQPALSKLLWLSTPRASIG